LHFVDSGAKALQQFVVSSRRRHFCCAWSAKIPKQTLLDSLDARTDFPLQRDISFLWRIIWDPKSVRLGSLAESSTWAWTASFFG